MRHLFASICFAASVLLLTGCGGDDAPSGGATAANTQPAAGTETPSAPATGEGGEGSGEPASTPEGGMPGMPQGMQGGMPGGMPGGPGGMPGGMPSGMPGGPGAMPGGPGGMPGVGDGAGAGLVGAGTGGLSGRDEGDTATTAGADVGTPGRDGDPAAFPGGYPGGIPGGNAAGAAAGLSGAPPGPGGYPGGLPGGYPGGAAAGVGGASGAGAGLPGIPGGPPGFGPGGTPGFPGGDAGGGTPGSPEVPAKPLTYEDLAKIAFSQGRERDAFQYLYAWSLTSDAGASKVLPDIQWVPGLKRPSLAVRWGVGLQLNSPPNFSADPSPIGSNQELGGRGRPRGGGDAAPGLGGPGGGIPGAPGGIPGAPGGFPGGPGGFPGGGDGAGGGGEISRYAGEFGQKILEQFQSRVANGQFGKTLKEAPAPGSGDYGAGGGDGGVAGPPGFGGPGAGAGLAGAPGFGPPGGGPGGPGLGGAGLGGPGMPGGPGGGGSTEGSGSITAGLTNLGTGSDKELIEKAKAEGVDVLALFKVKLAVNRAGLVINETEIVLVDPNKGSKPLYSTATLTNTKVQQARQQNKDDGVDREVKRLFEFVDKDFMVAALPEILTADIVKTKRVDVLAKMPHENPLPVLTEIRFYHRGKLLSDDDTAAAFGQILGSDGAGKTLIEGKEEDRRKVLEKWLPKS